LFKDKLARQEIKAVDKDLRDLYDKVSHIEYTLNNTKKEPIEAVSPYDILRAQISVYIDYMERANSYADPPNYGKLKNSLPDLFAVFREIISTLNTSQKQYRQISEDKIQLEIKINELNQALINANMRDK
jgi:hypothetical protein